MSLQSMPDKVRKNMRDMLMCIYEHNSDLAELAKALNITINDLLRLNNTERIIDTLDDLRRLGHAQSSLYAGRFRNHVVQRLLQIAADAGSDETARRACVDLLKHTQPDSDRSAHRTLDELTEMAVKPIDVQALLAELGRATVEGGDRHAND